MGMLYANATCTAPEERSEGLDIHVDILSAKATCTAPEECSEGLDIHVDILYVNITLWTTVCTVPEEYNTGGP